MKDRDQISRQAAIDELVRWGKIPDYSDGEKNIIACAIGMLSSLPSAEPERAIKDCRNCKHGNCNDHWGTYFCYHSGDCNDWDKWEPSAQPNIKQAAKLLSDFIESCPGGDSYLITPNGEELRTDWGYAMEGIQLIHDWAERRTDG